MVSWEWEGPWSFKPFPCLQHVVNKVIIVLIPRDRTEDS